MIFTIWRRRRGEDHLASVRHLRMKLRRAEKLVAHQDAAWGQRDLVAEFENHRQVCRAQCGNDMFIRDVLVLVVEDTPVQQFSCSAVVKPAFPAIAAVVVYLPTP
jgi:hypothetical protein